MKGTSPCKKKILRTFAMSVVFIGALGPIGIKNASGMYTEALEDEVTMNKCRNLLCKDKPSGIHNTECSDDIYPEYNCERCEENRGHRQKIATPSITLVKWNGATTVTIRYYMYQCKHPVNKGEYFTYMCKNPDLSGKLKTIWDRADMMMEHRPYDELTWQSGLAALWASARILDNSELEAHGDFTSTSAEFTRNRLPEFVVENNYADGCDCCTII
ncbi:hypothetical protein QM565_03555 [Geitlerinema splendidum]|nr:hypothetical protein [Geitlerinema splendidum]